MDDQTVILDVKGLKKSYGNLMVVHNINFKLHRGEILGLLGPNGAGKSTCIECILGTKKAESGTITMFGRHLPGSRRALFQRIGVQFQDSHYPDRIRVREICEMIAVLYKPKVDWETNGLLRQFSLEKMINKSVADLSGGERQKLSVALALIHQPELVFLDELTTGLDPKSRREVWEYLTELKKKGLTILLTSHYMDEAATLCDQLMIINNGKEVIQGSPGQVISEYQANTLEDAYLKAIATEEDPNEIAA